MKVFYSWQMDAPRKTNKDFIHGALVQAAKKLSTELDVSEAERDGVVIDQDTQGVLGSPEVARVILGKIAASDVVVADVSLVADGLGPKKHINSNVGIELGYTYGKLGDEAVLKVMNTHYGPAEDLPFDLRTRRHPVQFSLGPDADVQTISLEKKRLAGELAGILRKYLQRPSTQSDQHVETPSVDGRGVYWSVGDLVVPGDTRFKRPDAYCSTSNVIYFRCIPETQLPDLTSREAYEAMGDVWPLLSAGGYSSDRNKWGAISHCIAKDGTIMGFTQLFKNREIWGVDAYYANVTTDINDGRDTLTRVIPTGALNRDYPKAIEGILFTATKLGYGQACIVEMGVSGAAGVHLAIEGNYRNSFPGPLFDDVYLRQRQSLPAEDPVPQIMNAFWDKLFAEAGLDTPRELVWRHDK